MGNLGVGELVVLFIGLAAILALFGWVLRVMERGKRRFDVEKNANRPAPATPTKEVKVIEKEKIIERQIVVVRCQFCRKTTPVELRTCEHCGAPQ